MSLNPDFKNLFAALNERNARYLLVGGYALAFHAQPRFTKVDIWVEPHSDNAQRVYAALQNFGAPTQDITTADLSSQDLIYQIGMPPNRIDILTGIDGVVFSDAWSGRDETTYGDQPIHVIGHAHLVQNKRASGRPQDLIDLELLERGQ